MPLLAAIHPDLGELMRRFGSMQVRVSGTVGGNIANGSPIGDLAPALIALGGEVVLRKGGETRALPLEDFFIAYGKQDRAPGEFVLSVEAPRLERRPALSRLQGVEAHRRGHFRRHAGRAHRSRRKADRRARASPTAAWRRRPKRAAEAERALAGASLDEPASWRAALRGARTRTSRR